MGGQGGRRAVRQGAGGRMGRGQAGGWAGGRRAVRQGAGGRAGRGQVGGGRVGGGREGAGWAGRQGGRRAAAAAAGFMPMGFYNPASPQRASRTWASRALHLTSSSARWARWKAATQQARYSALHGPGDDVAAAVPATRGAWRRPRRSDARRRLGAGAASSELSTSHAKDTHSWELLLQPPTPLVASMGAIGRWTACLLLPCQVLLL